MSRCPSRMYGEKEFQVSRSRWTHSREGRKPAHVLNSSPVKEESNMYEPGGGFVHTQAYGGVMHHDL